MDAELRAALGIGPDEELDAAQNYFDLEAYSKAVEIGPLDGELDAHLSVHISTDLL